MPATFLPNMSFIYREVFNNDCYTIALVINLNTFGAIMPIRSIMSRKKTNAVHTNEAYFPNRKTKNYQEEQKTIEFTKPKTINKPINLLPKTLNQEKYIVALTDQDTDLVVVSGPAGTGKTYLALLAAIKALRGKACNRIVLCRPAVSVENENHGFLPGDLNAKLEPWVRPMLDVLREYYSAKELEYMLAEGIIEFSPLGFMRGRTFKHSFIILDEAQNCSPEMVKMLCTRIGENTKIVLCGDVDQSDRLDINNGLLDFVHRINNNPVQGIKACQFEARDIQRHRLIGEILKLYR